MATGGFKELAEDLECPICMGELDIPKVLQCKHVFCAGCLQKWLHGNKLVCPVCRYEHIFDKKSGISDLPEPLIISKLQEKITKFLSANLDMGPLSRTCEYCDGKATHFCPKCIENLCDACTKLHSKDDMTKAHKLTLITRWTVCSKHTSRFKTGYCEQCKVGLCGVCKKMEHANHTVVDIQDERLINDKTNTLKNYKKQSTLFKVSTSFNAYKDELNQFMKTLQKQCTEAEVRLEKLRQELNTTIDELQTGLRQHLAAEEKKMVMHKAEIDDIRVTRDSLFTFIDDVLQRNSAPDIVMAADELPDVSDNTAPVPPMCKQLLISDYDKIIQSVKDLVKYKKQTCTAVLSSGHRSVADVKPKMSDVDIKAPEPRPAVALSSTKPSPVPVRVKGGTSRGLVVTSKVDTASGRSVSAGVTHAAHTGSSSVSPPLSAVTVGVGARSKKGGGKIAWDDKVPVPQSHVSREYTQVWEVNPGGSTHDVIWDEKESVWWMRATSGGLYKYDMGGSLVTIVGERVLNGWGHVCIDTTRGLLVTTDYATRVVCMRKSGKQVKEITVPGCGHLRGITYCPHRDVYVLSDIRKHCLWFIDSDSGQVVQQLGSGGTGDNQFSSPYFILCQSINHNTCHIIVSDSNNYCIKLFSHTGEFIRKFGSKGSGDRQLRNPGGVCVDGQGRVVVCDSDNKRVVRYWWDEGEKWEVILNTQQLQGSVPCCVSMSHDGRHLVVGMWGSLYRFYSCGP